jgi:hypothetical protein
MIGLFFLFALLRTTVFWLAPGMLGRWDILLPFMIYFGQRRPLFEGLLMWFVLSHLYTLQSVAPVGVFVIYYLVIFAVARLISEAFYANTGLSILVLIFILSVVSRFILPAVAGSFESGWRVFTWSNLHPAIFLTNTLLGWFSYLLLEVLDKVTFKVARQDVELSEGLA